MSSASDIRIAAPPSEAVLKAFCKGLRFSKLLGATMDRDLRVELEELDIAVMENAHRPRVPEKEILAPTPEEVESMGTEFFA